MNNNCKILRLSLTSVWLLTATASWRYPEIESMALLERVGLSGSTARSALYAGIMLDAAMGLLTLVDLRSMQKWLWFAQGIVIITYSLIIAICLPEYALHPFGVLIKNLPLLAILWILWRETYQKNGTKNVRMDKTDTHSFQRADGRHRLWQRILYVHGQSQPKSTGSVNNQSTSGQSGLVVHHT